MFKKFIPALSCFSILLILVMTPPAGSGSTENKYMNTYPNLPAPIGEQKIVITTAGQAAEGMVIQAIAEHLNLQADYRPRVLDTDLYDYNSVVIVIGFSVNGLAYTHRTFTQELERVEGLVKEAEREHIPLILINVSGDLRNSSPSFQLLQLLISYADYYIGLKQTRHIDQLMELLQDNHVPFTLVNEMNDMRVPFNSVFR